MGNKASIEKPWLQHYGHIPHSLSYPDKSLWETVFDTIEKHPKVNALNYFGSAITYKQLHEKIERCAKAFKALGVQRGDKVTICMPNTPEAVYSFYAVNMLGAVANMIHPLSAENEIKRFVNITDSRIIVAINISAEKISNIINETCIEKVIVASPKDSMPPLLGVGYQMTKGRKVTKVSHPKFVSFESFLSGSNNFKGDFAIKGKSDDPAAILYSGGTTGESKGIILTNLNLNAIAVQGLAMTDCIEPGDRILAIMPVFHGFGLALCVHIALYAGVTSVLVPQFDMKTFHKLLAKHKPNIMAGVPTLYEALMRNKKMEGLDLSFLKCVLSGGDSLSVQMKERVDNFLKEHNANVQVREGYGLTESVTGSCLNPKNNTRAGSVGIPLPDTILKIVNRETNEELNYGEEGEICVTGPTTMQGYMGDEEETNRVLQTHEDGQLWLHTGDLGYMEPDGFIHFRQRIKRMIITSGYNVYPQIVEQVLESHPAVAYSSVIGLPDAYSGQKVKAYIVLNNGFATTEETQNSIKKHCEMNIAKYAMPKEFEYKDSLPKTLVGKVNYRALELENAK